MLRGIRNASNSWLGRAIMIVVVSALAVIFGIFWNINDIFRGYGRSTVAKIGRIEIAIDQFRQAYSQRQQQVGRQLGRTLTPEQASAIGLDRQVLGEMLAEAAVDQRTRQMGLNLSDAEVVQHITADPMFQGTTGRFDRFRFEQLLRNAGYSEARFIAEQRRVMLRRQIIDSLTGDLPAPRAWLEAINQFQNEQRGIEYVTLGPAQAGDIPQPSAEDLNKYFEARKILFRAPEYRKIATTQATPADVAKLMEIADAEMKAYFEAHRSQYMSPERRQVEQIVFPSTADADAAEARIKDGLSFAALAAERGLKPQDIDLGMVSRGDIIDPAVAGAAFSLKEGEVSPPIKGRFGSVIVTVPKIEPEQTKTFAEVMPLIRGDIVKERAKAEVQSVHDKIEDTRAGGSTLEEAAEKAKLPVVTYEVDRSGRDPGGKLLTGFAHGGDVVSAAFASDVGVDNEPIEADGGYIWYSVTGITPARERTLDEVRSDVEARWREDEIAMRLKDKAADLLDKLKNGNAFDALAKADGLTVQTADKLTRGKATGFVSAKVASAVFRVGNGSFGSTAGDGPSEWVVFHVTGATTPPLDVNSPETKRLEELVKNQESNDIFAQYVAWLQDELGTSINQTALAQALGTAAPDTN